LEETALSRRRIGPAAALLLLSPFMAEFLSLASPAILLLIPPFAVLDLCIYGCGALLIRELAVRWGKGWPSVLAMGVAFAIVEEGLVVSSFFDPLAPPRLDMGGWGAGPDGTNWVWIPTLCVFHAVVAVALPILLVHLAFPSRARERWLSGRRLTVAAAGLVFGILLGRAVFGSGAFGKDYYARMLPWQLAASLAAIALLGLAARLLPARIGLPERWARTPAPGPLGALSAACYLAFFGFGWVSKEAGLPPGAALAGVLAAAAAAALGLLWASSAAGWRDRHRFAVPAGVIAFYVCLSPLGGVFGLATGVPTGYFLWRSWRAVKAAAAPAPAPAPAPARAAA
jgi:hypothetical protein